ncbi:hypothetical protein H5410_034295, partial [Solanum commersonii]
MLTEFFLMNKSNKEAMDLNLLYREFPEHFVWSTTNKMWTRRKRGHVIGRVVTCHPTEGERYYLRLLLMNVRGPKSYEDLRTVNGVQYNSFREAAEKRELLLCDNNLVECMSEAATYQMPSSLRQLFAMLLIYCNPTNPRELWERFENPMSEDFEKSSNLNVREIRYKVLNYINDVLHSMGRDINEFELISEYIKPSSIAREAKEVHYERNIIVSEEDLLLKNKLNTEQRMAYNIILDRVLSNKFGAFFIDGPGGTGKSFLYRALLATVRHKGFIALATASSGVAASLLQEVEPLHSRFKIPIDVNENFTCNISKQSSLASLIRDARLIVWDEISMAKKKMVEAFDLLLRDLMETNTLFGGKIVVFSGDFRQTLPVVRSGKKEDFIRESLLCSEIWNQLEKLQLSKNMRATKDPEFCEYLMRIGDGKEKTNDHGKIEIPHSLIIPFTSEKESLNLLFRNTYPDLYTCCTKTSFITSRAILTTKNDFVDEINDMLISQFPNTEKVYIAIDETIDPKDQSEYEDFLHTLNPIGLPPYKLSLKKNCPIMLLRNLNPSEGLCNGTRYFNMAQRYTINMITPDTKDWTCKVQVVDKSRPRDNKDKTTKYQVLVLQDEEENQVQATIFSTDITYFENEFAPFKTYLVSVAHVKLPPLGYENPLNKFVWTLDKNTIVEPVEEVKPPEDPLPPPTRLTLTTFHTFEYQSKEFEFVLQQRRELEKRIQEFILMDKKKPTKLTLWEDFIDHEGVKLFNQLHDYPIILARRIGKSSSGTSNRFVGLTSKFNTTIEINPPYPQAAELKTIKTIETKLVAYKMKSTTPIGSIMLIPFEDEVISVANIQAQPPGQVFNVEAELSLASKDQRFSVLACSNCKQLFTRYNVRREIYCTSCHQSTHLIPRCQFELTIKDNNVLQTAIVSDEIAEKMLHLTSEEIYEICFIKLEHFCCGSRNGHFLHSFAAAIECRVLQASDVAMWMPSVPLHLWKLKIFSPVIA